MRCPISYGQNSDYLILEVSNPESLTELGQDTEWCTKHLHHAEYYIVEEGNKQYVVFKKENGKYVKFAQFAEDFSQFKNVDDHEMQEVDDSCMNWLRVSWKLRFVSKRKCNLPLAEENKDIKALKFIWLQRLTSLPEGLSVEIPYIYLVAQV